MGHNGNACPENPSKKGGGDWKTVTPKAPNEQRKKGSGAQESAKKKEEARLRKQQEVEEAARAKKEEELKVKRAEERKKKAIEDEKKRIEDEKKRIEDERIRAIQDAERKAREAEARIVEQKRKVELRLLNDSPKRPDRNFFKNLNTNVKKCGSFPKKLAGLNRETFESIKSEFDGINLSRYVPELVTHIMDAPLKSADVFPMIEMCSAIHQRYADFLELLLPAMMESFNMNDPSKVDGGSETEAIHAIGKRRTALRLITESFICGLETDLVVLQRCISELIKKDTLKTDGSVSNLMMLLSFVRRASSCILGIGGNNDELIVDPERAQKFHSVFDSYFDGVCEHLTGEYKKMKKSERWNKQQLATRGTLSDKSKEGYEEKRAAFEKLLTKVQQLAESLAREMPALVEDKIETMEQIGTEVVQFKTQLSETEANSKWLDEEMRSFYEDLPDLEGRIPGILLGLGGDDAGDGIDGVVVAGAEEKVSESSGGAAATAAEPKFSAAEEKAMESAGQEAEDAPRPKTPLDVFMLALNECFSKRKADEAAEEFVLKFGDKNGRNRLVEALFNCPRSKLELIPRFCRIVATLSQYPLFKAVAPNLLKRLESQFFYLLRRKNQMTLEGKLRNIRFIGEMSNFMLCTADAAFHLLNKLMDDFQHHNVDVTICFLEVCGRFFYRSPETHVRTRVAMERMMRLKEANHLDERLATGLENAYYHCNPPEVLAIARKVRSPVQQWIRHLIYRDMDVKSRGQVVEGLRRLDWTDKATVLYAVKSILKLSRGKFSTIPHLAFVVAQLAPAHEMFVVRLVDGLIESIRLCLEDKKSTEPQSQIMYVRLLGELFLQNVVDSRLMFDMLYTIVMLSVSDPNKTTDSFRIRLACTLLETTCKQLAQGSGKDRLIVFCQYLQRYFLALKFVQLDLHFAFNDTLEKMPVKIPKFRSLVDASQAIRKLEGVAEVDPEQRKRDEEQLRREEEEARKEREAKITEEEKRQIEMDRRKALVEARKREDAEERAQFDRELAAMMSEKSGRSGKGIQNMMIPQSVLYGSTEGQRQIPSKEKEEEEEGEGEGYDDEEEDDGEDDDSGEEEGSDEDVVEDDPEFNRSAFVAKQPAVAQVQFKVLLRGKGSKAQARDLYIPENSDIATRVRERQDAEVRERNEIAQLVLQKAKLVVGDSSDELTGSNRLNRSGMNVKKVQIEQAKAERAASGPPTRSLGKKF